MLIVALSLLAAPAADSVQRRVDSDLPNIEAATGGLVKDGTRLRYDLENLFGDMAGDAKTAGTEPRFGAVIGEMSAAIEEERKRAPETPAASIQRRDDEAGGK